tara:strand:- start:133 stop:546 length:414 start_codon:yes stop_codon:yes gene_type:complete
MFKRIIILIILISSIFIFYLYQERNSNNSIILKSNQVIEYLYEFLPNKKKIKVDNINNTIEYFIQLGIFAKQDEVDKIRAKTSLLGLDTNLEKHMLNGKLTTKIFLGPFNNKKLLDKTCKLLKDNSVDYIIINKQNE